MLGSSVICIILRACPENSVAGMNIINEIGRSVTVFHKPRRLMRTRMLVSCILVDFVVDLSV